MKKWVKIVLLLILLAALAALGWEAYEGTKTEVTFIPHELDEETQVLRGDLMVKLGWQHRREKQVLLNLDTEDGRMFYAGNCLYVEPVELSLQERKHVFIDLREEGKVPKSLYMNSESGLLPIDIMGCGFVMPEYADGVLNLKNSFNFTAEGQDGPGCRVDAPEFRFYLNGEVVHELEGVRHGNERYFEYTTSGAEDVCIPCETGDEVKIAFSCKDGYGLGYEFTLIAYVITERGLEEHALEPEWIPALSWD